MKETKTLRRALLTVLLLAILATVAMVSVPPVESASNCTYYSDATYTTVVGQFGTDCCNNRVAWGVKTQFSRCGGCFICFPPPPR